MLFAISGVECSPLAPFLASLAISFCTSMAGISGAFLLLPFQIYCLGYVHPSVSATNQLYNIMATPAGIWSYYRQGRLLWPLAACIITGTLPGVFIGVWFRAGWLADTCRFLIFASFLLLFVGMKLLAGKAKKSGRGTFSQISFERFIFTFLYAGEKFRINGYGIATLALLIGIAGGIYGVGGGAIMAPFLAAFFHLPPYITAGATLLATFATSLCGTTFFLFFSYGGQSLEPDWLLGGIMGLGGVIGMYLGARMQIFVPLNYLRYFMGFILVGIALFFFANSLSATSL